MLDTIKMGRHGTLVIPASMRRRLGLKEGELVMIEDSSEAITIRPAVAVAVEIYTPERQAAFLLENAVDAADHAVACDAVRAMGLDPDSIEHQPPGS
jgi:AbrB family looped-hinge helix DNA binding protein